MDLDLEGKKNSTDLARAARIKSRPIGLPDHIYAPLPSIFTLGTLNSARTQLTERLISVNMDLLCGLISITARIFSKQWIMLSLSYQPQMKGEKKKSWRNTITLNLKMGEFGYWLMDWSIDHPRDPLWQFTRFLRLRRRMHRTDGRTGTHLMWGKRSRFSGKGNEGIPSAPFRQSTWGKGESSHRGTRFSNMSKRGSRSMDGEFEPRPQASSSFPTSKSPGHVLCMPMVRLLTWLALALPGKKKNKIKGVKKGTHRWN